MLINTKTYSADSFQKDSISYTGPLKSVSVKDELRLARTAPRGTVNFSGLGRTNAKMVRSITLTNALTPKGDVIGSVDVALPVGASSTDVDNFLDDLAAFVASDEFKAHVTAQKINF